MRGQRSTALYMVNLHTLNKPLDNKVYAHENKGREYKNILLRNKKKISRKSME